MVIQALSGNTPTQLEQGADGELKWNAAQDVHPRFLSIVTQMARYHFQDRYQQAAEVIEDLNLYTHPPKFWQQVKRFFLGTQLTPTSLPPGEVPKIYAHTEAQPQTQINRPTPISVNSAPESAVEPPPRKTRVVLSAFSLSKESILTQAIYTKLQSEGYEVFVISQSLPMESTWVAQLNSALQACDFYILLLCPHTANSEVLLQEVRTVKALQVQHHGPTIIPIRVEFPFDQPLNFELRGYLQRIPQYLWRSPQDTDVVLSQLEEILTTEAPEPVTSGPPVLATVPPILRTAGAPPLPVAEPEIPAGQVQTSSAFYVERSPIESRCAEVISQPGSLIRIKAPRQMGKTSLMARILKQAQAQGSATVAISLQLADAKTFSDLDRLLQWLCATVSRRLKLPNLIKSNWDEIFGSKYNCTNYFEEHILPVIDRPLVLGFDEVDRVFEHPAIASDFFGLLRAWHEEGKNQDLWQKLHLIVVHATEVYIPLNANQSPFNVGLPVELPPFNEAQIRQLAERHRLHWTDTQVAQIQTLVGGHPYLVRLAMYHLSQGDIGFEELVQTASDDSGLFCDHLRGYWWKLQKNPVLAQAFGQVIQADQPVPLELDQLFQLHSLGLVHLHANEASPRCELYRQYFREKLAIHV
ncbi:MAG: AAA-like domain-containing protein [Cyanobacteria bacterium P01_F01_bin.42]